MAPNINFFMCNHRFHRRTSRYMGNFNADRVEITVRYRNELDNPFIVIEEDTRICMNCYELLRIDLKNANKLDCLRLRVLKTKSTNSCCICENRRRGLSNRIPLKARVQMPPIKRKTWDHAAMIQAVNAVRRKEIGYLRAAKQFGVPKGTLERYVKRMSAQKILSRFVWEDGQPCLLI
ncbi:hypothetical protein HHI36_019536 [Cryptolaemus montrouzieri]|uniref:HTH psq-type domain-containing protein n=2 Tax=Cryptolaemus montrouzieri TaxID=559131 RepID=A0ABD2N847_9CUCU